MPGKKNEKIHKIVANGPTKIRHKNGKVQRLNIGDEILKPSKYLLEQAQKNSLLKEINPSVKVDNKIIPGGK